MTLDGNMWEVYAFESWQRCVKYPSKLVVLDTIKNWKIYSHGLKLNELELVNGAPKYRRDKMFYMPKDIDQVVDVVHNFSLSGYRIYAISPDILQGVFFVKDDSFQEYIDADIIQGLIDYSKRLELRRM